MNIFYQTLLESQILLYIKPSFLISQVTFESKNLKL